MNEQVKVVMQNALLSTSKGMNVDLKTLRIQMKLSESNGVDCFTMNGKEVLGSLSWNKILGLKYLPFRGLIVNSIENKIQVIAKKHQIEKNDINVRVYAINEKGEPNLWLYDSGKPITQLDIKELV